MLLKVQNAYLPRITTEHAKKTSYFWDVAKSRLRKASSISYIPQLLHERGTGAMPMYFAKCSAPARDRLYSQTIRSMHSVEFVEQINLNAYMLVTVAGNGWS